MNQPSSSRFPTNDCYIYERYKTFLLNSVSFMALVSLQVNITWAAYTPWDKSFIFLIHISFISGCSPKLRKLGFTSKWLTPRLVCILALNATKEAIRFGGGGGTKLILQNNDQSSEMHYRLIVINGVYATSYVTHSIINSMCNIMIWFKQQDLFRKEKVYYVNNLVQCIT